MDRSTRTGTAGTRDGDLTAVLPLRPARRGAAVVLLVGLAVVTGALAGPWDPRLRGEPTGTEQTVPPPPPPAAEPAPDPVLEALEALEIEPWDLTRLWVGLAAIVVVGLLYLGVRWLRTLARPRDVGPSDPGGIFPGESVEGDQEVFPDLLALLEGLEGADQHLRVWQAPSDAVIAAWVALEEGAGRSGIVRHPASTPTEFTVAVLDRTDADRTATRILLSLYLRARFGAEPMSSADVGAATAAVSRLIHDLAAADEPEGAGTDEPEGAAADEPERAAPDAPEGETPGDGPPQPGGTP